MGKTTTSPEIHSKSYTAKFEIRMVTSEGRKDEEMMALANAVADVYSGRYKTVPMAEVEIAGYNSWRLYQGCRSL